MVTGSLLGMDFCLRKTLSSLNGLLSLCSQIAHRTPFITTGDPLQQAVRDLNLEFKFKFLHQLLLDFQNANTAKEEKEDNNDERQQLQTPEESMRFVVSANQVKLDEIHVELARLKKKQQAEGFFKKLFWPIQWQDELRTLHTQARHLNELIHILLRLGGMRVFPLLPKKK